MTNKKTNTPFTDGGCVLTPQRLQNLYSQVYSGALLREAKKMLIKQQKEHAPLLAAFKARQKER